MSVGTIIMIGLANTSLGARPKLLGEDLCEIDRFIRWLLGRIFPVQVETDPVQVVETVLDRVLSNAPRHLGEGLHHAAFKQLTQAAAEYLARYHERVAPAA